MRMKQHMKFWRIWKRREVREAELERELHDHLDLEAEENRDAGLSPQEAEYTARRALGNALRIKEDVRMSWASNGSKRCFRIYATECANFAEIPALPRSRS